MAVTQLTTVLFWHFSHSETNSIKVKFSKVTVSNGIFLGMVKNENKNTDGQVLEEFLSCCDDSTGCLGWGVGG